jgi:hypothetical protein
MVDIIPLKFIKTTGGAAVAPSEMNPGDTIPGGYISGLNGANLLINGDMRINQRVFAGGALAAGVFGYDRMFADTGGCNVSVNQTTGIITHTSGTWCQAIEAPRGVFGATVTVSVADLSGGSLTVSVGGVSATITAGTGRRYVNVVAPSSSGTGNLLVKFTGTSVTYREVAVVRGSDMAGFQQLDRSVSLLQCQRFWQKSYLQSVAPATPNQDAGASIILLNGLPSGPTYLLGVNVRLSPVMRATPSIVIYSKTTGASGKMRDDNAAADVNASVAGPSDSNFFAFGSNSTAIAGINLQFQWSADAEITS